MKRMPTLMICREDSKNLLSFADSKRTQWNRCQSVASGLLEDIELNLAPAQSHLHHCFCSHQVLLMLAGLHCCL